MAKQWFCGYCGGLLVLNAQTRCRLCLRLIEGWTGGEMAYRDSAAVKKFNNLKPGLGDWYTANKDAITAKFDLLTPELQAMKFRPTSDAPRDTAPKSPRRAETRRYSTKDVQKHHLREDVRGDRRVPKPTATPSGPARTPSEPKRPTTSGPTWQDAEKYAAQWMRAHGYPDATVTPPGADGGVDVDSRRAVAQVKHRGAKVPLQDVQRLSGIAHAEGKTAIFFSLSGYTKQAQDWGERHGVRCITYGGSI